MRLFGLRGVQRVGDLNTNAWLTPHRKLTDCLVQECGSSSEVESRREVAAGGRIVRRVHVSRGRADRAYVGTAYLGEVGEHE